MLPALQLLLQRAGPGVGFLFVLFFLVVAVGGFLLWAGLAYWTYTDAKRRNMDSPELWGVVVLVGGVIAIVAYLIVRD